MVRSVLEIMSFSKMSIYNDDTYAVRDLSSAKNFYMSEMKEGVLCGWLSKDGDGYSIEDCGEPYRISHREIDKALNINFSSKFTSNGFEKTSEYKYNLVGGSHKEVRVGEPYKSKTNAKYDKRLFCKYDSAGEKGTLVLTGQPTARKNTGKIGDGKGFEFVFMEKEQPKKLAVAKDVFEKFLFAYFDKRETEPKESPDWKYWKNKLKNNERVPVFFKKGVNGVAHFGLSYLYKLPYNNSVSEGIPSTHINEKRKDLVETIFGYIGENEALKGRVQFSHFVAKNNIDELEDSKKEVVLGTPRASYYPMYVQQESGFDDFITFMNSYFSISGRKRYPINSKIETYSLPTNNNGEVNRKVVTTFTPLKSEVLFNGKMRYHNLKKFELGALLSALTFHNTNECFHNIGMAKSLGYGKIELKLNGVELEDYLKEFESEMTINIPNWAKSEQLTELLTMATEQKNNDNSKLRYLDLKEFAKNKSGKCSLQNYTKLDNIKSVSVQSLVSKEELEKLKKLQSQKEKEEQLLEKEKEKALKEQEEKKKKELLFTAELNVVLEELKKEEGNLQVVQNFIDKYPNYEKINEIKSKKEKIEKAKKDDRHKEVNEKVDRAYEALQKKEGNQKQYLKEKEKFVKKWSKEKENKGSSYILEIVEKLQ
jgi:CRISPR-associated protein (TIGR03986 family)